MGIDIINKINYIELKNNIELDINGVSQAMVQGIKNVIMFKDNDKNIVTQDFIDFLKSKI